MDHHRAPSGAPIVPDRAAEFIWAGITVFGVALSAVIALYVWIELQLPEAVWSLVPMALFSCVFIWPALKARNKRLAAAIEMKRYRSGVQKAASEI